MFEVPAKLDFMLELCLLPVQTKASELVAGSIKAPPEYLTPCLSSDLSQLKDTKGGGHFSSHTSPFLTFDPSLLSYGLLLM